MLSDYSKIILPIQAIETNRIVTWKGKKEIPDYVKRLFVD
jgi:hypothetical protein